MSRSRSFSGATGFPDVTVASVQMEPVVGEKAKNLQSSVRLIEQAAAKGARVVVLPELCSSGYVFKTREEAFANADEIPGGESTAVWAEAARRLNIYVVAGTAERAGERLFNSAVLVGPEGYIGTYRKLHLWGDEHLFFEAGDLGLPVFHTEIGRLAVLICYDGWFPEVYRLLAMRGADVVCMPTNWVPMAGQSPIHMPMANTLAMASAHSNSLNIVCANRVGTERGQKAFDTLVFQKKVDAIISMETSAARNAALPIVARGKVPYIYTSFYEGRSCSPYMYVNAWVTTRGGAGGRGNVGGRAGPNGAVAASGLPGLQQTQASFELAPCAPRQ